MGLDIHPSTINRLHQEAIALQSKRKFQASLQPLRKILQYISHHFPAWHAMGTAWKQLKNPKESLQCLEKSLHHCPEYYPAAITLATLLYEDMGKVQEGKKILVSLLEHHPQLPEIHLRLSDVYLRQDNFEQAKTHLKAFIDHHQSAEDNLKLPIQLFDYQLVADLHIDPFLESLSHEREGLKNLAEKLEHHLNKSPAHKGIPSILPFSPFYLAYYHTNPKPYLTKIANLYRQAYPDLAWTNPHLARSSKGGRKINIGIVSGYLDKFHPIGFCFSALLKAFNRDQFSLTYFRLPVKGSDFVFVNTKEQLGKIRCIDLPEDVIAARTLIADQSVDILWYTDVAMMAQTYFLAHARLAPIQCVSAGHPMTTGIPTMDYFISSQWLEGENAQDAYSEKLILLPTLPVIYEDFPHQPLNHNRAEFGLPEQGSIYFCCQTLFKVHPSMDEVFKKILEQDPQGWIVFGYKGTTLAEKLEKRLEQSLGPLSQRCLFIPRVHQHQFFNLLSCVDVLLDTFPFGGGNTTFQGLSMGVPIITMDNCELRGASTKALYRMMGMDEGIALSLEEYAQKCVQIAQDHQIRQHIRDKIRQRKSILFSQKDQIIQAYETVFQEMMTSHHSLNKSTS